MRTKEHIFYWLHGAIAIVCLSICSMFYGADQGHPPGIIFPPIIIIAWLILHVFLFFIQWLASQGRKYAFKLGREPSPWPISLIIVVALFSVSSLIGLAALAANWDGWDAHQSIFFPIIDGASFICLCGILLRRNWGRLMRLG